LSIAPVTVESLPERAQHWAATHRKTLLSSTIVGLLGFSAVAFGVAPLAPDAADLPQRLVIEEIHPQGVAEQLEALAAIDLELNRADLTRASDTPESLLARLGVVDSEAAAFLRRDPAARALLQGRAGKMVQVVSDESGRLNRLVARYPADRPEHAGTHFTRLTVERSEAAGTGATSAWTVRREQAPLQPQVRLGSGTIRSSLFAAADEAHIPDSISSQIAEAFSNEIDFHRELRQGDHFAVVYEALTADGEPITWNEGTGRLLAAEFVNGGRTHHAVWFGAAGKGGYFSLDGKSKQRSFLSSPLAFSRITSGFAMRFHPIHQTWRAHRGIDYSAPKGTPIRSVGAGVVEFSGWQKGYGNAVEVRHANGKSTFYAHMSRVDVRKGQRIEQGQNLGAVGSTGWSTGPHLHFEFRVNGQHQDPRALLASAETVTIAPLLKPAFQVHARSVQTQLSIASSMRGHRAEAE
jgi:murein DD-endopeptidase MepM/ murein hydrolase activator NlpD